MANASSGSGHGTRLHPLEASLPQPGATVGDRHYRAFVGPPGRYDVVAAQQFNLLTALGLREHHRVLDIGCGSLRAGRLFIPYLLPGRYFAIEPEEWLVRDGIRHEVGEDLIRTKRPAFRYADDFSLEAFGTTFDYLLAQSIFSHAPVTQIAACLRAARAVMTEDSLFAANFLKGATAYEGDAWVYPGCVSYPLAYLAGLARDAGLAVVELDWPHPGGLTWIVLHDPGGAGPPKLATPATVARLEAELGAYREHYTRLVSHATVRAGIRIRRALRRVRPT